MDQGRKGILECPGPYGEYPASPIPDFMSVSSLIATVAMYNEERDSLSGRLVSGSIGLVGKNQHLIKPVWKLLGNSAGSIAHVSCAV